MSSLALGFGPPAAEAGLVVDVVVRDEDDSGAGLGLQELRVLEVLLLPRPATGPAPAPHLDQRGEPEQRHGHYLALLFLLLTG